MSTFTRLGLRGISVLAALLLATVLGALGAWALARTMIHSDRDEAGALAAGSAKVAATIIERNLTDATAQMVTLAAMAQDTRVWSDPARLRRWLDTARQLDAGYSWIGLAGTDGRITDGSGGMAQGADVSRRDWFLGGSRGLYHGDLHEAMLLQKALPPLPNGEPWRFIDIALPLKEADGRPVGVLAAHLSWPWLRDRLHTANATLPHQGSIWLLGPDNRPRLGHDPGMDKPLSLQAIERARAGDSGWLVETWPDGKAYVTGYAPNPSPGTYGGLGWVTLVRAPADAMTATDRQELQDMLVAVAVAVALICLLTWAAASLWSRPLREFVGRIAQLREGQRPPELPRRSPQEFHELNHAILRLVDRLEQKEAVVRRNLEEMRHSFRTVGSRVPGVLATVVADRESPRFHFVSEGCERYLGVTADELRADFGAWGRHANPQDLATLGEGLDRLARGEIATLTTTLRMRGADGAERTLQGTMVRRDEDGERLFDIIALDVSDLMRARTEAERANRAKSDFLATMSHELRTPLNAILGFAQVLEGSLADPVQRTQARYVRETSETLTRILNDVLDIAKIESGKFDLDPRPFSVEQVFDSCASIFRVVGNDKNIAFDIQLPPGLPRLVGDPVRLRQILHNLLSNAFKFTSSGSVSLRLTAGPIAPRAQGRSTLDLRIEVQDTGLGMTPEQMSRLFQRFEQGSRETAGQFGGTGLGLAIVKALVEKMEGTVAVDSTPGAGTRFTLDLPFRLAASDAAATHAASPGPMEAPLHVLVVDDFPVNRAVLRALLEKRGHRVTEAEDGVVALDKVAAGHPDLVLMDLDMPHLDGLEASRRIRAMPDDTLAATPVFALTGKAFAEDIERSRQAGMNGHLAKPVQLDELVRVLASATHPRTTP